MLWRWRSDASLSQAELAKAVGVSQVTIAAWEAGTRHPTLSIKLCESLASALGISPERVWIWMLQVRFGSIPKWMPTLPIDSE